jgi:hypothetical protein
MKRKSEKQMARETAEHMSMVERSRKEASVQIEAALFAATFILRFHGELIIQSRETAIVKAMEMPHYEEGRIVFFTGGAVHIPVNKHNKKNAVSRISPKQGQCQSRHLRRRRNKVKLADLEAELAGIAGALAIAISSIKGSKKKTSATPQKVVISYKNYESILQIRTSKMTLLLASL